MTDEFLGWCQQAPVETPEAPKADHEVVFLFNFFDELRRKVPLTK
jgi:hypothetical protein